MLPFFVIIPTLIAVFLFMFSGAKAGRIIAIGFQTALAAFALHLFLITREQTEYLVVGDFYGLLGIVLRADNLAAVFVLLTSIIFLVITIYTFNERSSRTYWFLIFLLEAALIGLFLTRDFFNIFVLVEVSTVLITILLMYNRKRRNLFTGMTFIMINIVVMQFYLFGLGYIYMLTGVLDMEAAAHIMSHMNHADLVLPYALIMTAVAAKCSLLPLFTWLPKVNSIPGSRSAVAAVMSGLHIKSGVYLFIRFQDVFGDFAQQDFFVIIGVITGIAGVIGALAQTNIKLVLSYSTIAQIGLLMIGLNMDYAYYAYYGSLFHIINHSIFKTALFMGAGMIANMYATQEIDQIRGLFRVNKTLAIATVLSILGIVGVPLFNGSVSKYFMMRGATGLLEWAMIIINLGTILICIKYCAILFGRPKEKLEERRLTINWFKQISTITLGVACFILGIFGEAFKNFAFNLEVHVDALSYLEKAGVFAASVAAGLLITKFVLKDGKLLRPLRNFDLSFKTMCVSVGAFFALMIVVAGVL